MPRLATRDDLDMLVALMGAFYAESDTLLDEARARAAFGDLIRDARSGRVWLCEKEGRALGYAVLTLGYSMEYYGRDAFLDDLYVVPEARGRAQALYAARGFRDNDRQLLTKQL